MIHELEKPQHWGKSRGSDSPVVFLRLFGEFLFLSGFGGQLLRFLAGVLGLHERMGLEWYRLVTGAVCASDTQSAGPPQPNSCGFLARSSDGEPCNPRNSSHLPLLQPYHIP